MGCRVFAHCFALGGAQPPKADMAFGLAVEERRMFAILPCFLLEIPMKGFTFQMKSFEQ